MKVAIYARYSSDNQRDASITDQFRVCREFATRQGWTIVEEYSDHAVSGATLLRAGFQALMRDALNKRFDVVLAESLDRFSRDQEDTAGLFKRLTFAGVNIVTLAEGDITFLHIGLKGTMNALFLKDLAEKTHRGLRGRIEDGKSGGGLCYGYRVVKTLQGAQVSTGEREIEPTEAAIVRRVFRDFIAGHSPKKIAQTLNREGVPGPFGGKWSPSTLYGNAKRGTGLLNNELYVGRLVWNRQRFVKDPDTGKRVARMNPRAEWIAKEVPQLRIVSDGVWAAVKERQERTRYAVRQTGTLAAANRPKYLFSGLTKCGVCGAGFVLSSGNRLACFGAREQATCNNRLTIKRDEVEARVLTALKDKLLRQDLFEEFCDEFTREMNRLRSQHRAGRVADERELERLQQDIRRMIQAIKDGFGDSDLKVEWNAAQERKAALQAKLEGYDEPLPLLHPGMADLYRQKVAKLAEALEHPDTRTEAAEAIRGLIDAIVLTPVEGALETFVARRGRRAPAEIAARDSGLRIELKGNLAAMLTAVQKTKRSPETGDLLVPIQLVAGAGFEPATFGL
jgi:site-specific DNA recombinase